MHEEVAGWTEVVGVAAALGVVVAVGLADGQGGDVGQEVICWGVA